MRPESRRVVRHVQQDFSHSVWSLNDRKCLLEALKRYSVEEVKQNAQQLFEKKSPIEVENFLKKLHHGRQQENKIKSCNPEFKFIDCINLWSQLIYDIIGEEAQDNSSFMIGKLMSLIGSNELPKNPDKSNGVNYKEIYNYFSSVLMGLPAPTLSPLDSAVVLELLENLFLKLSISEVEAHEKVLLWKYDVLSGKQEIPDKDEIQRVLENDFQDLDTSDLSDSNRSLLLEPGKKHRKKKQKTKQTLNKVLKKTKALKKKVTTKAVLDEKTTVVYELKYVEELLEDGTKATVVKLNPIAVNVTDPSDKPAWESNQSSHVNTVKKENPEKTSHTSLAKDDDDNDDGDDDDDNGMESSETALNDSLEKKRKLTSEAKKRLSASTYRSRRKIKRLNDEDTIASKLQKIDDSNHEYFQNLSDSEPFKSIVYMPDVIWVNPLCIPPHLANIELTE
ncbi:uncharacterized protein LOC115211858 isoform X1 [Argonauta hians]